MKDALTIFNITAIIIPFIAALAVGLAPLKASFRRRAETNRARMLWIVFITAWLLNWAAFAGIFARLYYDLAAFYFDTTFGLVKGMTRSIAEAHALGILVEIWLRQLFGWLTPTVCFSASEITCQLADEAKRLGSFGISPAIAGLIPALFSSLIARWLIVRRARE